MDDYIQAEENLEAQQLLFSERVSAMFEYQNKSTLEVLLESDNIAGFFTNMEIITLIADAEIPPAVFFSGRLIAHSVADFPAFLK